MTREELYELVWARPMTKVSTEYGLSDVGLRKICVKFNVPTPPLGYWAKLAHGKPVKKSALHPAPVGLPTTINLCPSGNPEEAQDITSLRAEVVAREAQEQQRITINAAGTVRLHTIIADLKRLCREVGEDPESIPY